MIDRELTDREFFVFAMIVGLVVFLATSLVTMPGWSTGADGRINDIERHFGWPAEYYADLWQNSAPGEPGVGAFMFLIPVSWGMALTASDFSFAALLVNAVFAACLAVLIFLFGQVMDQERIERWVAGVAAVTVTVAMTMLAVAESVGAYL